MTDCPSCHQPLPEPGLAFCPHCGTRLLGPPEAAEPPPLPELPVEPSSVEPSSVDPAPRPDPSGAPWERRAELGLFTALVDTTLQVLSKPREFFRRLSPKGGLGSPLAYAVIVGYVGLVATAFYDAIFESLIGAETPDFGLGPEVDRAMALLEGGPGLLVQIVLGPFILAASVFIGAALNHVALMALGGPRRDFEATFRVGAYSKAAAVVSLVPLCGPFVAIVWGAVATIIGLQIVHDTTLGKAIGAVLLPVVVACCCCAGTFGVLGALMAAAIQ